MTDYVGTELGDFGTGLIKVLGEREDCPDDSPTSGVVATKGRKRLGAPGSDQENEQEYKRKEKTEGKSLTTGFGSDEGNRGRVL